MARLGVEVVAGHHGRDVNEDWLRENRGQVDVLHLNWPHYMYDAPDLESNVLSRCADVLGYLSLARSLGYRIVWTVHNLYPHDRTHFHLHRLARLTISSLATALIVHCEQARALVRLHFHRTEGVFTIPHGHFMDAYPNTLSGTEARQRLGIAQDSFVYLFFGNLRPYKGVEDLLDAFCGLKGKNLRLLLAVKERDPYSTALIERARQLDPRILVQTSHFFPNEDFQLFLNAADVAVFPFLEVLTSGSAITALSFGRPVIAPSIGCLPELLDEGVGIAYERGQADALGLAMEAIRDRDLAACGQAAFQRARSLSWEPIARLTLEAYRYQGTGVPVGAENDDVDP
jgi:glycosyltransferase involved in cell wall biosynthesis